MRAVAATGAAGEAVMDLVDRGVLRVFDLLVIRKDEDGSVSYEQQVDQGQAPPPSVAPSHADVIAQLQQLGKLRDDGVLTDEEFAAQKAPDPRTLTGSC